ncbi:MAG: hypothetical protein ACQER7_03020 [Bacteroidota bacterium]
MMMRWVFMNTLSFLLVVALCGCNSSAKNEEENEDPEKGEKTEYAEGFFPGEVPPPESVDCFPGAYYRKVVTSEDHWLGIEGEVSLPETRFDSARINPDNPSRFMDNPSIYVGGNSNGQETDLGLTWEVILDEDGNVTPDRRAFRPFLRRTGYDDTGQEAVYENAPAEHDYYWYPGDQVKISLKVVEEGVLRFTVEGEGKKFEKDFPADGYREGTPAEYKRVNAIDQVGNEGKDAAASETRVEESRWSYTSLWRVHEGEELLVPLHSGRLTGMQCPESTYFEISRDNDDGDVGAETIVIDAGN